MKLDHLPEDCITRILSLTSPCDAGKSSVVSSTLRSAAEFDLLWESFLPSDYREVVSRSVSPVLFRSKKELFLRLCMPLLIDGGKKIFWIQRFRSKKCYMLSARELSITWSSNSLYWAWKPSHRSRFGEVAELITISWLEIQGKINTLLLSPNTTYGAYLVVDFADRAYGLDSLPSEVSVEVGNYHRRGSIYLRPFERSRILDRIEGQSRRREAVKGEGSGGVRLEVREDGWSEIELGEFFNGGDGSEREVLKMSLKEVKGGHLKGGLLVEGIELRPKG
ncbi:hypothetical protein U1Q18_035763 [Sarracenia purpurea var. burkii]